MDNNVVDYPKLEKNAHLYNIRGLNYGKSKVFHSPYVDVAQLKDVSSVGELSSNECRNDKEDGKSSQEQFVEEVNIGKQEDYVSSSNWKSEDIHSLAVNELKLEDDSIKEESFFSECINDEESKSFQEQLIEGEKIWKREDFISHENWKSEAVHSMSVDEMKLEDNSSMEELSFNERSIDEVWMKEDFISSKDCVSRCDKKQLNAYGEDMEETNICNMNCRIGNVISEKKCNFGARQKRRLQTHIDDETTTTYETELENHAYSKSLKIKNYECNMCGYITTKKDGLKVHIERVHPELEKHECQLCEFITTQKSSLEVHTLSVHLKLKCHICKYESTQKGNLKRHIDSVHLKLKIHKCHMCEYTTTFKRFLKSHIDSVHLKLKGHKCEMCEYTATQKFHLNSHIDSVHLKLKTHKCNLCEYTTAQKSNLNTHIKSVHLKLKNHKCQMCDYTTTFKSFLEAHINSVHLKLKNLQCHMCQYSTSIKCNLAAHIKRVHS